MPFEFYTHMRYNTKYATRRAYTVKYMANSTDIFRLPEDMFTNRMEGGAFIFSADKQQRILRVNNNLVRLFECEDADDFMTYTGGTLSGMIHDPEAAFVQREIETQLTCSVNGSGYVFYNIKTKLGNVCRIVNHWTLVNDDEMGDVFYATVYRHRLDNASNDFDVVTGLLGKRKFDKYAAGINKQCLNEDLSEEFAIIYLNLVNFKKLNLEQGVNEGNSCLKVVAKTLGKAYENAFVSRLSDDHFAVFTESKDVIKNTENAIRSFAESYGNKYNVVCKFGIYRFTAGPDFFVETAISRAKVACDYVKHDVNRDYAEYTDELAENVTTREYVVGKIDDAIANGWLKVYFQPVIRSVTGQICSMESLVRWNDPEIGFLPPDKFIGALEEERCIHKLDSFVIDKVCEVIGERLGANLPTVPASVNLSRLDFVMCDMLSVVEEAVAKHGIPKEFLHIEVTESMISSDEELMRRTIDSFHKAGYEIWMDDFGSGYSSLTVLKDYDFNTVKLDMRFLTPLTEKSKSIIKSVVTMAKDIGMKTLAEGVETREQLDFLREIGCGLIQGYYYGRPEPVDEVFRHLKESGIEGEKTQWSDYYQAASFYARATDMPLEIIEDDGKGFRTLFMNKAYRDQLFLDDMPLEDIDRRIYDPASPMFSQYREYADIAESSKQEEAFYYSAGSSKLCLTVREIAQKGDKHILIASITNFSKDNRKPLFKDADFLQHNLDK